MMAVELVTLSSVKAKEQFVIQDVVDIIVDPKFRDDANRARASPKAAALAVRKPCTYRSFSTHLG